MRKFSFAGAAAVVALILACGGDSALTPAADEGVVRVRLTDRPMWADSVEAVNIWVVRVDARMAVADSAEADSDLDDDASNDAEEGGAGGWVTIAEPNALVNVLLLHDGVTALMGETAVDTGDYRALRLIIDESKSSIVLKNGTELTNDASPFVKFPSAAHSGLKINFSNPIRVAAGDTTVVLVDFDLDQSFVMRGNNMQHGLIFKPVLRASIVNE